MEQTFLIWVVIFPDLKRIVFADEQQLPAGLFSPVAFSFGAVESI